MRIPIVNKNTPEYVVGMGGICTLFGCSPTTAYRYRSTWLAPAVTKTGRALVTNVALAQTLWMKEFAR